MVAVRNSFSTGISFSYYLEVRGSRSILPAACLFPAILHEIAASTSRTTRMMNMALMKSRSSPAGGFCPPWVIVDLVSGPRLRCWLGLRFLLNEA